LSAPPLISTSVFKDEVNESAADDKKPLLWHDEVKMFETPEEGCIHDTYDNGLYENSLDWSLHLLLVTKKNSGYDICPQYL
jgi:hypothetical protein